MRAPRLPICFAAASALAAGSLRAQSIEVLRQQLREDLSSVHFAQSLIGLVTLSDELELSGARYSLDDSTDTDLTVFALPFHSRKPVFGDDAPRLHFEGSIGYGEAREALADIWGGALPGGETAVSAKWRSYGFLVGTGLEFAVAEQLHVTPLVDVGLSRIENDARYTGPGAAVTAALFDGIALNWSGLAAIYGTGLRTDWHHALSPRHRLDLVGRYDLRWTDMIESDDAAQDFTARSQMVTLRGDLTGPTPWRAWQQPIQWQLNTAFRGFPEQSLFGVREYVEFGGTLLFGTGDALPYGKGFAFSAAAILGEDLHGWTIGGKLLF